MLVVVYVYLGIAVLAAICWLIGYIIHLRFGRYVLEQTKDATSLKHAAEFTRSYRSANFKSITDAIGKLGRRGPRSIELGEGSEAQRLKHLSSAGVGDSTAEVDILGDRGPGMA